MTIGGDNVRLRLIEKSDLEMKVKWINDPEVHAYLHYETPLGLAKTEKWFESAILDNSRRDFVIETLKGKSIGNAGLIGIDQLHQTAEFYILLGEKQYWGKGIGAEAGALLVKWAFDWLNLYKIWATVDKKNVASVKMMEKIGFHVEVTLKEEKYRLGKWVDVVRLSLLRYEFESRLTKKKNK